MLALISPKKNQNSQPNPIV